MRRPGIIVVVLTIATAWGLVAAPFADAKLRQRAFLSPSRNISCELDDNGSATRPLATGAYCQTRTPARSVTLTPGGRTRICRGDHCLGDPGIGVRPLPYGHRVTLGPFVCLSQESGVRCTTHRGRGFVINRSGIRRL